MRDREAECLIFYWVQKATFGRDKTVIFSKKVRDRETERLIFYWVQKATFGTDKERTRWPPTGTSRGIRRAGGKFLEEVAAWKRWGIERQSVWFFIGFRKRRLAGTRLWFLAKRSGIERQRDWFFTGFRKQRLARTKSENWWPPTGTSRGIRRAEGKFLEEVAVWKRWGIERQRDWFVTGFRKQRLARTKSENWWPPTGTSRGIRRAEGKFLEEVAAWKRWGIERQSVWFFIGFRKRRLAGTRLWFLAKRSGIERQRHWFFTGFRKQRLARTKSENWWPPTGTSRGIRRAGGKFLEEVAAWKRWGIERQSVWFFIGFRKRRLAGTRLWFLAKRSRIERQRDWFFYWVQKATFGTDKERKLVASDRH